MTNNIPYIPFKPHKWLVATSGLPPYEKAVYITICALLFAERNVWWRNLDDHRYLAAQNMMSVRMVKLTVDKLVEKLFVTIDEDGRLRQNTSENSAKTARKFIESSSKVHRKLVETETEYNENNYIAKNAPLHVNENEKKLKKNTIAIADVSAKRGFAFSGQGFKGKVIDLDAASFKQLYEKFCNDGDEKAFRKALEHRDRWYIGQPYRTKEKWMQHTCDWLLARTKRGE